MPFFFRLGLIATVAALAGVRASRSLRAARRAGRTGTFDWARWHHVAILWGTVLFCVPFALAMGWPSHARWTSAAVDRWLTGGFRAPAVEAAGTDPGRPVVLTEGERASLARTFADRARIAEDRHRYVVAVGRAGEVRAWVAVGAGMPLIAALVWLSSFLVARRALRPGAGVSAAGLVLSCGAFACAGLAATELSGAARERETVETYAAARPLMASQAEHATGPVRVVGRATAVAEGRPGCVYYLPPDGDPATVQAPWAGFRMEALRVAPASRQELLVVLPTARLGAGGREDMISADEDVMVLGFVADATIAPREGFPVIVAPAGERRVFDHLAQELFGAARRRGLYVAMLQVVAGAAAMWFLMLISATLTELAIRRVKGPPADLSHLKAGNAPPSITQMLRYGG